MNTTELPFVSVVIPVLNGADRLPAALAALRAQRYPADRFEIIVVDGGSRDATREVAAAGGARVLHNPRGRVAPARNLGFAAARGDVVAFTDDDCTFPDQWMRAAVAHLDGDVGGVSGPTRVPSTETNFGRAVAFAFALAGPVAGTAHRERVDTVLAVDDLPGCNCFFRREALTRVMPSDESLVTAEDVEVSLRVRRLGYRLLMVPAVQVWHHKRQRPRQLFRQMRRYAIGRLQLARAHPEALRSAHVLAGLSLPALAAALATIGVWAPGWLGPILAGGLGMLAALGIAGAVRHRSVRVGLWVPIVVVLIATGWSLGFLQELLARPRRRAPRSVDHIEEAR